MSNDLLFEIAPSDGQLRLNLKGGNLPAAGYPLSRPPFRLPPDQLDQLRRGDAPPALVQHVKGAVSQWLLDNDLIPLLLQVLGQQNDEPVRLIFTTNDEQLRSDLADVPFELVVLPGGIPLALRQMVASLVHLLPYAGIKPPTPISASWPFRVLIVHSNPPDLGGQVPDVAPIRDAILKLRNDLDPQHLQVDVLSRQDGDGVVGRPTPSMLRKRLNTISYDVLVYFGHGDLQENFAELPPVGVLQLESDDGDAHTIVLTDQLAQLLHDRPVPVVLLVGCLTAAQPVPDEIMEMIPQWMRGSQGVTQALVNSESGVHFAVGMRYRIDGTDAKRFLAHFFRSLLVENKGNVEAAVRAGRTAVYWTNPNALSWSAPMVFRTLGSEPMFPVLASAPSCPSIAEHQERRAEIWKHLAAYKWSYSPEGRASMHYLLEQEEQKMRQVFQLRQASLIMPDFLNLRPEESPVTLQVHLYGSAAVDELEGRLVAGNGEVNIQAVKATEALKESGYNIFSDVEGNQGTFLIKKQASHNGDPLPEGPLFDVTMTLGSSVQIVCPVTTDIVNIKPPRLVCSVDNAVIVAPP
jgi:hypothetical protein